MSVLKKIFIGVCTVWAFSAKAQDSLSASRSNLAYAELGGPGGYYSFGYQHKFNLTKKFGIAAGGYVTPFMLYRWTRDGYAYSPRVGAQLQFVYSTGRHEIGIGAAMTLYAYYYHRTGEYQKPHPSEFAQLTYGYTFRNNLYAGIAFTPQLADHGVTEFVPWGSLRAGYKF